jgi:hypothetical protein
VGQATAVVLSRKVEKHEQGSELSQYNNTKQHHHGQAQNMLEYIH